MREPCHREMDREVAAASARARSNDLCTDHQRRQCTDAMPSISKRRDLLSSACCRRVLQTGAIMIPRTDCATKYYLLILSSIRIHARVPSKCRWFVYVSSAPPLQTRSPNDQIANSNPSSGKPSTHYQFPFPWHKHLILKFLTLFIDGFKRNSTNKTRNRNTYNFYFLLVCTPLRFRELPKIPSR